MIIGLSLQTFTTVHVIISLLAIASGIVVLIGMLGSHRMPGLTALFLITTILTSVTGFLFPIHGFTPGLGTGAVSLVLLAIALYGLYGEASRWDLALDLCRLRRERALSQCLSADRSVVPKSTKTAGTWRPRNLSRRF